MATAAKKGKQEEETADLFTPEEEQIAEQIEKMPIEEIPYEIQPLQGGGPASL